MILAAGRGERMRPLTDDVPKPLLEVQGKPLIVHHIQNLRASGITNIVINVSHLKEQIKKALGDGSKLGVTIAYSQEDTVLETGGGICKALSLLGDEAFWVVNGDVLTDYPFKATLEQNREAHLVLVENPEHHPSGDFSLSTSGDLLSPATNSYTYSGIGIFHPRFFAGQVVGEKFPLAPLFRDKLQRGLLSAELFTGHWLDVGTPERLEGAQQLAWLG